jgi:Ca-activated chloride channel family protein
VTLSGSAEGEPLSFSRDVVFPSEESSNDFLPRLWATRKIGFLLDQIRLNGEAPELVDEIVSLSRTYGIITPYTSYLIVEDTPPEPITFGGGFAKDTGADAVAASESIRGLAGAISAPAAPEPVEGGGVRAVGRKTFYLRDGEWRDADYVERTPTVDVQFGSERYFDLLVQQPTIGPYLSLGKDVIVSLQGVTYRIGESIQEPQPERADLNGNGRVDFRDFLTFARAYGKTSGETGYHPSCDLNGDDAVDFADFLIFGSVYGM